VGLVEVQAQTDYHFGYASHLRAFYGLFEVIQVGLTCQAELLHFFLVTTNEFCGYSACAPKILHFRCCTILGTAMVQFGKNREPSIRS
jgi:hypothetical protein